VGKRERDREKKSTAAKSGAPRPRRSRTKPPVDEGEATIRIERETGHHAHNLHDEDETEVSVTVRMAATDSASHTTEDPEDSGDDATPHVAREMPMVPAHGHQSNEASSPFGFMPLADAASGPTVVPPPTPRTSSQTSPPAAPRSRGAAPAERRTMDTLYDEGPEPSAFDELAIEMDAARSQLRNDWHAASTPDRFALVSALAMMIGVFLPWLTLPDGGTRMGISMAGVCHLLLSVQTLRALKRDDWGAREFSAADRRRRRRRGGLSLVLYGALSVLVAVLFLFYWGYQKTASYPVQVRFGVYWTLAWGTGQSYGGLSRFTGGDE